MTKRTWRQKLKAVSKMKFDKIPVGKREPTRKLRLKKDKRGHYVEEGRTRVRISNRTGRTLDKIHNEILKKFLAKMRKTRKPVSRQKVAERLEKQQAKEKPTSSAIGKNQPSAPPRVDSNLMLAFDPQRIAQKVAESGKVPPAINFQLPQITAPPQPPQPTNPANPPQLPPRSNNLLEDSVVIHDIEETVDDIMGKFPDQNKIKYNKKGYTKKDIMARFPDLKRKSYRNKRELLRDIIRKQIIENPNLVKTIRTKKMVATTDKAREAELIDLIIGPRNADGSPAVVIEEVEERKTRKKKPRLDRSKQLRDLMFPEGDWSDDPPSPVRRNPNAELKRDKEGYEIPPDAQNVKPEDVYDWENYSEPEGQSSSEDQDGYGIPPEERKRALNTDQINLIMKEVPHFIGTVARDQISDLAPLVKDTDKFSFIYNTDPSNKPGAHWRAFHVDFLKDKSIEHYDSFGDPPADDITKQVKQIIHKAGIPFYLKYKTNRIPHQHADSALCGYHCIRFLKKRHRGGSFIDATHYKGKSKNIMPIMENMTDKFAKQIEKKKKFQLI